MNETKKQLKNMRAEVSELIEQQEERQKAEKTSFFETIELREFEISQLQIFDENPKNGNRGNQVELAEASTLQFYNKFKFKNQELKRNFIACSFC